jgi:isopenicillin N synthase-like dioxygenase
MVGREVKEGEEGYGSFSTGPNLWPSNMEQNQFQERVMDYQKKMLGLVATILDILARGLPKDWNCPTDVFEPLLDKPSIPMRFLHYGPVETQDARQFGGKLSSTFPFACVTHLHPL